MMITSTEKNNMLIPETLKKFTIIASTRAYNISLKLLLIMSFVVHNFETLFVKNGLSFLLILYPMQSTHSEL